MKGLLRVLAGLSFASGFLLSGLCGSEEASEHKELKEILQKMEKRSQETHSLRARFRRERYFKIFEEKERESGLIYYARPRRFRMDREKPYLKRFYIDEKRYIEYIPDSRVVHWYDLKPEEERPLAESGRSKPLLVSAIEGPEELQKYFNISLKGYETVDKKKYALLLLVPKDDSVESDYLKVILWVRLEDALPLRVKGFREDEEDTWYFTKVELNPKLPKETFEFRPPKNVTVEHH